MKLSILIATTTERRSMFEPLMRKLMAQQIEYLSEVEIISKEDNKEMSIGAKRQWLLENCKGEYIVFFDDDDNPYDYYIDAIMKAISKDVDCAGIIVDMTTNGRNPQRCCHSLEYPEWKGDGKTKIDGFDYVRNVTHFNPVRRELALRAGFPDIRFGEDKVYSDKLTALCQTQAMILKPLFQYRYSTAQKHNEKYGIR